MEYFPIISCLKCTVNSHFPRGVLVLPKLYWAPDFMEFVLGRFSHFNIAIAYSNSTFCGAWTPSFCEFTQIFSKTSTPLDRDPLYGRVECILVINVLLLIFCVYFKSIPLYIGGVLILLKFWHFSSELTKSWSSGARKYWTQKLIFNLTFTSFLLFVYMSVFYNTVPILFTN